jgi:GWxTD domain-containing protein
MGGLTMKKSIPIFLLVFFSVAILCALSVSSQEKKGPDKIVLPEKYKKWLDEEVPYIISENERDVFKSLRTDEERENFIKTFWKRRDPTPDTPVNEYREEHYRRLAYADKSFFEGRAGWRTDRGRVYIMFGPPDFMETNPGGGRGFIFTPQASTAEFPAEIWTYRNIVGENANIGRVDFTFVNYYSAGSYQLASNPALANALRNISVPARYAGYNDMPYQPGQAPTVATVAAQGAKQFEQPLQQLALLAELTKSRGEVLEELERSDRLRKLKGVVETKESMSSLSFYSNEDYFMGSGGLTYIPVSIEVAAKDLGFNKVEDKYNGRVSFFIEIKDEKTTLYQGSDKLEMNLREETYKRRLTDYYQYVQSLSLKPGEYFVHIVVWDEVNGNVGYVDKKITVPSFGEKEFGLSEVVLARDIKVLQPQEEKVIIDSKDLPALKSLEAKGMKVPEKIQLTQEQKGPFVFGNLEINPNTLAEYTRNNELIFFYQIYNLTFDEAQNMAKLLIEHQVWQGDKFITTIDRPQEAQIPVSQKTPGLNSGAKYNLSAFEPGRYTLLVRVKDIFSGKTLEKRVDFRVK